MSKRVWQVRLITVLFVGSAVSPVSAAVVQFLNEAAWQAVITNRTELTFDGFTGALTSEFPGLTFSSVNGGNLRAASRDFALTTPNVLDVNVSGNGGGGGWALDFESPVRGVGFWTLDTEFPGSTITFRDPIGTIIGSAELAYPHPLEWSFEGFVSSETNIARVEVAVNASDYIAHDNLQYGLVPEPITAMLLLFGTLMGTRPRRGT